MTIRDFIYKLDNKLRYSFDGLFREKKYYYKLFPSYYHKKRNLKQKNVTYFTCKPTTGAGIGHQMSDWMCGFYFAKVFGLEFASLPFTSTADPYRPSKWEDFLGLSTNEKKVEDLVKEGYRFVTLPTFHQRRKYELQQIKNIVESYRGEKVILRANGMLVDQYLLAETLSKRFFKCDCRKNDKIIFDDDYFNIALHIRRQVIIENRTIEEDESIRAKRWTGVEYYKNILEQVREVVSENVRIYVFSTGNPDEFKVFENYGEVHFCSDLDEYESFANLVRSDLLVTSKSSFSYCAGLITKGIRISPEGFWHTYGDSVRWLTADDNGNFFVDKLKKAMEEYKK